MSHIVYRIQLCPNARESFYLKTGSTGYRLRRKKMILIHVLICVNMYLTIQLFTLVSFWSLKNQCYIEFYKIHNFDWYYWRPEWKCNKSIFSNQTHCIVSIQLSRHSVTLLIGHIDLIDSKLRCCKGAAHGRKLLGMNAPSCITYL